MLKKSKMKKRELIKEVLFSMRGDLHNYEDLMFDLAEEGLKKWSKKELEEFLG